MVGSLADEPMREAVDDEGELEAAYGCTEGATGVRGEYAPDEVSSNIAVPMANISSS